MSIPTKISLALGIAVACAATFQVGWEMRGIRSPRPSVATSEASMGDWGRKAIGVTWIAGVAAIVALFATRRTVARPIRSIVDAARQRRRDAPAGEREWAPQDEFSELAREIEAMREALEQSHQELLAEKDTLAASSERLRHWDRLSTLGRVASTLAHELGTPLNVVEGRATMLLSGEAAPAEVKRNAQIIVQQSAKMTAILRDLVSFARRRPSVATKVDLSALVRTAVALADTMARARNVHIVFPPPDVAQEVQGDADKLLQATMNLLMNGIQAMPQGGTLTLTLRSEAVSPHDDPDGPQSDHACLVVTDTGTGIAEDVRPRIFQPFFTTKIADEGVGLGLAIAQSIAKDHRGSIDVESEPGRGASFTLRLPKGDAHAE